MNHLKKFTKKQVAIIFSITISLIILSSNLVPILAHELTDHDEHDLNLEKDTRAILFKFSGNGGSPEYLGKLTSLESFMENNSGTHHDSAWNRWHYEGGGYSWNPFGTTDCDDADPFICNWTGSINDAKSHALSNPQKKIVLAGFSFGGGAATFLADELQAHRQVEGVLLSDPVGPGLAGNSRAGIMTECKYDNPNPIDSFCTVGFEAGICENHSDIYGNSYKYIAAAAGCGKDRLDNCPADYPYNGIECAGGNPCPSGFAIDAISQNCYRGAHRTCSTGFEFLGSCWKYDWGGETIPWTWSCPTGGDLNSINQCIVAPICPAGFRATADLKCARSPEWSCPVETTPLVLGGVVQACAALPVDGSGTSTCKYGMIESVINRCNAATVGFIDRGQYDVRAMGPNIKGIFGEYHSNDNLIDFPSDSHTLSLSQWAPYVSGKFVSYDHKDCYKNCHSHVGGHIELQGDFIAHLESLNKKPFFEPGVLPSELTLNEGDSNSWPIHTPDPKGFSENINGMDMTFRNLTSAVPELDIDIDQGSLSNINNNNNKLRAGSLTITATDNVSANVVLQVEDNGWPCGGCTSPGNDAMGSKGHWARTNILVTVLNVAPTVYSFGTFEGNNLKLFVQATDPSPADTLAGFNYTVNWGDGSNEVIHGNSIDVLNHLYEPGEYTITVSATDKDGGMSEVTLDVETPFQKLLQLINGLRDNGTLNKGNANSFISKVNGIIQNLGKPNPSACNVAEALINEIKNGFEKPGKLPLAISDELVQEIQKEKEPLGCSGGVIDVVKQTDPDGDTTQFTFAGDVSGTIADGEKIRLGNLTSGTYSSTETVPSGWMLSNILCSAIDYTKDLSTKSATINLQENEYAVCVFFNMIDEAEPSLQTIIRKDNSSTSSNNIDQAVFFSLPGNSNPSPQTSDDITDDKKGRGDDEYLTRPTFGVSHETHDTIVDNGFRFNDQSFAINDNHHTPFAQQTVNIGDVNSFEAKLYADKRLKVQEFLFGIPNVGEAHLAELGVEVWYDYNGNIEDVKAVQKSNVIDKETIVVTHEKVKCQSSDTDERCDVTNVSMVFLEPLKDKVMAIKAIDYKGRYQITYLNEGVDIAGESLNPMLENMIPSNVRDGGLIKVTQIEKYSPYWESDDGRMFEMNIFGSFKEVNQKFERFHDDGTAYTRLHSEFYKVMEYELKRSTGIFDASELVSELPDSYETIFLVPKERITDEMKAKMKEQEAIAKEILEKSRVQARW